MKFSIKDFFGKCDQIRRKVSSFDVLLLKIILKGVQIIEITESIERFYVRSGTSY